MTVKIGVMNTSLSKYSDTLRKSETHKIIQVIENGVSYVIDDLMAYEAKSFDGENWKVSDSSQAYMDVASLYIDDDPDTDDFVRRITNAYGEDVVTYTWTTPLTEVPGSSNDGSTSTSTPIAIAANTDLNTLVAPGDYYREANIAVTNAPSAIGTAPFAFEVLPTGGTNCVQRITRGAGTPATYQRTCYNGTVGSWTTL